MKYKWLHNYEFNVGILKDFVDNQFFGKVLKLSYATMEVVNEIKGVFQQNLTFLRPFYNGLKMHRGDLSNLVENGFLRTCKI